MSYPLGKPIREEKPPEPEWKPVLGKPFFEVNAAGQLRYVKPPTPPPWHLWGFPSP
jgi:hypothetical protein